MKILTLIAAMPLLLFMKGAEAQPSEENLTKIRITANNLKIEATLNNSPPAKDLRNRLPLTLELHQHQKREYYANIRLEKNDKRQEGYQTGDIAYWASGNALVFFYAQGYTDNLIIMGKMTSGMNELSQMENTFQARIEEIED